MKSQNLHFSNFKVLKEIDVKSQQRCIQKTFYTTHFEKKANPPQKTAFFGGGGPICVPVVR